MTGFFLLIVLFTVFNSPLFSLNEFQALQLKQEISKSVFDTNRELGYSCVVNGCSLTESNGVVTVKVNWMTGESRIWIDRSLFFTVSEVYYSSDIRQKFVIYLPVLLQKNTLNQPIRLRDDDIIDGMGCRPLRSVYVEVPGGGGSGHNV
ncbi:MAG: hypothetical protein QG657_4957, partial [Acidobacteriota bacterium]|nr:hypothetical protein [Acidobacteriota bacterium]